jgi:sulfatase modifying factor 1
VRRTALLWLGLGLAVLAGPSSRVLIPAGQFVPLMGAPDRRPVRVQGFELERYPVTNQQFQQFVVSHPEWRKSRVKRIFAESGYLRNWPADLTYPAGQAQSPVTNVSWFAARVYCQSQGGRLPTQSEWELVGQASATRRDGQAQPEFRAQILDWYARPNPPSWPPVQQGFRNVYGVQAMHGLVWEWVEDFNGLLVTGESRGDSSLERGLYCAGGAVSGLDPSDYPTYMRYAFRSSLKARYTVPNLGFRVAYGRNLK